ncbi:MAG: acyl-ACP--UDP-N-acetylglucosamine O-acyltransferase [Elusimicrobiota bacterium]|jgi:UDP-N-acetylglucosamine acyltransferase|nr:acyl-ACP--UDP-N-acetylglucosamine O-acyltransferase [Elusimicrobiota bacterium]
MIHQTAVISETAIISENVEIGAYTVIGKGVVIGEGTKIGSNSYIEFSEIGRNCKLSNSVSVGTPPQDLGYENKSTKTIIGDGTVLREFVTVNRGSKTGATVVGKNCFFMACSHAGHDCKVGDNVVMANASALGGYVEVGENAFISALVAVHQFCRIGRDTMIAGGTVATMDVIPYSMCYGDRAVLSGLNVVGMKRRGMRPGDIVEVKDSYRVLFMSKLLLSDALSRLENSKSQQVVEIVNFIKNSNRGIVRPK